MNIAESVASGALSGRLWFYSNYHCNLSCGYCLTESGPSVPRRALPPARMVAMAKEAPALGFTGLGVTGGEPFLVPHMAETLAAMAEHLPVLVLTNATLFTPRLLSEMEVLAGLPVSVQVSLDDADADANDARRGDGSFAAAVEAIPKLLALGLSVRMATTGGTSTPALEALRERLGVAAADHVVRPIVGRGRAREGGLPVDGLALPAELTITADGAFYSPFAPTVSRGRLDTDLLLTRTTSPLARAATAMLEVLHARPPGTQATLDIL